MLIDCRNLTCPEPIIKVKKEVKNAKIGENIEILVNDIPPLENIKRMLRNENFEFEIINEDGFDRIKTSKFKDFEDIVVNSKEKIIFITNDSLGDEMVGKTLLEGLLTSIINLENRPKKIICVNKGVFLVAKRENPIFKVLKECENLGIEVLSCGACLKAFNLVDKLGVGRISNAFEIMQNLMDFEVVKL